MSIIIRSDGVLEAVLRNMADAPNWLPRIVGRAIRRIGPRAVVKMKQAIRPNRYTGALEDSIAGHYSLGDKRVEIYPSAQRGRWDAGSILELGTRPIPRAPYRPIAAWASAKGAPMPGAWLKIRSRGVSAHPFLDRTLDSLDRDLNDVSDWMLGQMIAAVLHGAK